MNTAIDVVGKPPVTSPNTTAPMLSVVSVTRLSQITRTLLPPHIPTPEALRPTQSRLELKHKPNSIYGFHSIQGSPVSSLLVHWLLSGPVFSLPKLDPSDALLKREGCPADSGRAEEVRS